MSDLISRQAAIEALEEKYFSFGIYREQRAASHCINAIKNLPSAQPTLYGYSIEHLALIARVMQKENVTPEKAIECFTDIQRIVQMVLDEQKEMIRREIDKWL